MTIHDVGVKRIDHTSTQSSIVKMESMMVVEELLEMLKDVWNQIREEERARSMKDGGTIHCCHCGHVKMIMTIQSAMGMGSKQGSCCIASKGRVGSEEEWRNESECDTTHNLPWIIVWSVRYLPCCHWICCILCSCYIVHVRSVIISTVQNRGRNRNLPQRKIRMMIIFIEAVEATLMMTKMAMSMEM